MVELEVDGQERSVTVSRDTLRRKKLGVNNKVRSRRLARLRIQFLDAGPVLVDT